MTNTPNSEQRLDKIEAILEQVAQQQQQLMSQQQQLTLQNQQSASRFDGFVYETQRLFNQLGERQLRTEAAIESLIAAVARLTQNADNTWAVIREMQTEVRGLQAENRRILDHLFGQQSG